jgi:hypothetical protein
MRWRTQVGRIHVCSPHQSPHPTYEVGTHNICTQDCRGKEEALHGLFRLLDCPGKSRCQICCTDLLIPIYPSAPMLYEEKNYRTYYTLCRGQFLVRYTIGALLRVPCIDFIVRNYRDQDHDNIWSQARYQHRRSIYHSPGDAVGTLACPQCLATN